MTIDEAVSGTSAAYFGLGAELIVKVANSLYTVGNRKITAKWNKIGSPCFRADGSQTEGHNDSSSEIQMQLN